MSLQLEESDDTKFEEPKRNNSLFRDNTMLDQAILTNQQTMTKPSNPANMRESIAVTI